jgi:hypothetical protein
MHTMICFSQKLGKTFTDLMGEVLDGDEIDEL